MPHHHPAGGRQHHSRKRLNGTGVVSRGIGVVSRGDGGYFVGGSGWSSLTFAFLCQLGVEDLGVGRRFVPPRLLVPKVDRIGVK